MSRQYSNNIDEGCDPFDITVDLERPDYLPEYLRDGLRSIIDQCKACDNYDRLFENPRVMDVIREVRDYCRGRRVLGIHYTRANRMDILSRGLLSRAGSEIRKEFLERYKDQFSESELRELQEKWGWINEQSSVRDYFVCFNFTRTALGTNGARYLLGMYGGEQIHMGTGLESSVGRKLAGIGDPLVVFASLNPERIEIFDDDTWGKILVSSYHLSVRPDAYGFDIDGFHTGSVAPNCVKVELVPESMGCRGRTQ